MQSAFDEHLARWSLTPDGPPFQTHSSRLLPVRRAGGTLAMLKVAGADEEKRGARLMEWWSGQGAARVLGRSGDALLLERATGTRSLERMARAGRDDDAARILCSAVAPLHAARARSLPELTPLARWFRDLEPAAARHGGILTRAAAAARELLSAPRDAVVLHGDIHHGNVLDFGERGWLAIDPKGLSGERAFDYANMFCNPDTATAAAPGRLARLADIVSEEAGLERRRMLRWTVAWAGLSSVWQLQSGGKPEATLRIAEIAAAEMDR